LVRQDLRAAIDDPVYRELLVTRTRNQKPPDVSPAYLDLAYAHRLLGNSFEELGILVKRGMVDTSIFLDRYSYVILRTWKLVVPVIALVREASGVPSLWENFEYLAVLSEDWMKQYPSSYPRGVRRMQVTNPWPIAAAPATT
jgi:hypothetical protein